jgi:hypothetical protein
VLKLLTLTSLSSLALSLPLHDSCKIRRRPARFTEMDWKQFVSKAERLSRKFLIVAVRDGELLPPKAPRDLRIR